MTTSKTSLNERLATATTEQLVNEIIRHQEAWEVVEDLCLGLAQFADGLIFLIEAVGQAGDQDGENPGLALTAIFATIRNRTEDILHNSRI